MADTLSGRFGYDVPLLARIPLEPSLREGGDVGKPIVEADPTAPAARELIRVAQTLSDRFGYDVPVMAEIPLDISLREGGDVGKPIVEADPTSLAARELTRVAQTLSGRGRGLAGMQLGLTPSSKL